MDKKKEGKSQRKQKTEGNKIIALIFFHPDLKG